MDYDLTKYERARLIGTRAMQLAEGAQPTVDVTGLRDPLKIAEKELILGRIPLSIIRVLPSGEKIRVDFLPPEQKSNQ